MDVNGKLDSIFETFIKFRNCEQNKEQIQEKPSFKCNNPLCSEVSLFEDFSNGEIVCTECGLVSSSYLIDNRAEWNVNGPDEKGNDPSRCGAPTNDLFEFSSMSTMISGGNQNSLMQRIHRQSSMTYVERARWHVCESIQKMAGDHGKLMPAIVEQAKHYYKSISEKKLSRGSVRQGLIACCILYACKAYEVNRSVQEISQMCNIEQAIINKSVKLFEELMEDEIKIQNTTDFNSLVVRFVDIFDIDKQVKRQVINQCKKMYTQLNVSGTLQGKTPSAITSALICYQLEIMEIQFNKQKVVAAHKVSLVTLNKIVAVIKSHFSNIN